MILQLFGLHHQWQKSDFYIQVLVFVLLLSRYQETTLHCISLSNRQVDRTTKQHNKSIFLSFCQLEQSDWARLLSMAKFIYINAKNTSTGHIPFELNCGYYFWILYKKKVDLRSQYKSANKLSEGLRELIILFCKNLYHT